jgi:HD-GYP domain-containing protein (c-di-GMP phosphodiesterase class II)
VAQGLMTVIPGSSLELGELPFNVHVKDQNGNMVLFGRKGITITQDVKAKIARTQRSFFIEHGDLTNYIDYKLKRVDEILENPDVDVKVKQTVIKDASTRIIQNIKEKGLDKSGSKHTKKLTESVVSLIMQSPENHAGLLNISSLSSYLYDHALNTSTFAIMLGQIIYGDSEKKLYLIGLGSMLMDIGMSKINSGILNKTSQLDPREEQHIRQHTDLGYKMLKESDLPSFVADMALHHHERMDGSGYPDSMSGSNIRPYLRICAVADVYDALTSKRPHRKSMSELEAIECMMANKGLFSMDVLHALMKLVLQDDRLINATLAKYK